LNKIIFNPIGIIQSLCKLRKKTPHQPKADADVKGSVVLQPKFVDNIMDLKGFFYIYLNYNFHLLKGYILLKN